MTYSIVARDPETGQLGVAVQSRYFSVGSVVTWAEAGVGAVATQAMSNVDYGPEGIALMRDGRSAGDALAELVTEDRGRDVRQVAMIDATGVVAAHTGLRCIEAAGHIVGDGFSVQANMMVDDTVWPAMDRAYSSAAGDLADRMLAALDAAQAAGGDIRGQQSAALLVVEGARNRKPWRGVVVELRVEDHARPLAELRRLLRLHRAYHDTLADSRTPESARSHYERVMELAPDNDELQFWAALTMFRADPKQASTILQRVFTMNAAMADLVPRLVPLGIVRAEDLERITALRPTST